MSRLPQKKILTPKTNMIISPQRFEPVPTQSITLPKKEKEVVFNRMKQLKNFPLPFVHNRAI
jgi:hypothetical protein